MVSKIGERMFSICRHDDQYKVETQQRHKGYFLKEFQMQVLLKMLIASQTQYMFQLLEEQVASLLILCTHALILSNSVREDAKFIEGGGEAPEVVQDKYQ